MDPDANLAEQLELMRALICGAHDSDDRKACAEQHGGESHEFWVDCRATDGERLADLVEALHDWIRKGGALPRAWRELA